MTAPDFSALVERFAVPGDFVGAARHGSGHINDTYQVTCDLAGQPVHYLLHHFVRRYFA